MGPLRDYLDEQRTWFVGDQQILDHSIEYVQGEQGDCMVVDQHCRR